MKAGAIVPLAAMAVLWTEPVLADPVADFYKGKTITVVSAGEAGGAHGPLPGLDPRSYRVRSARYKVRSAASFAETVEAHVRIDSLVAAE
jgi:hypothetical protein